MLNQEDTYGSKEPLHTQGDLLLTDGLDAFVAAREPSYSCSTCKLRIMNPALYAEVLAGRKRNPPHSYTNIVAYLSQKHGINFTANKLRDHFLMNHEERFR